MPDLPFPIVTITILISSIGFSIHAFKNRDVFEKYLFNAYAIKHQKEQYRFLSHAFLHSDYAHLIINMFVLYSFGRILESGYFPLVFGKFSSLIFILLYTGGIYASSIVDYFRHNENSNYNAVGASGAVSALVFSAILLNPNSSMGIIFIPFIRLPSWIFGLLYLAYSFYMDKSKNDNVAHGAHAWGAVFGFLFTGIMDLIIANPDLNDRVFSIFFHQITAVF
jgi:membrane associated rhomboid family serine protease